MKVKCTFDDDNFKTINGNVMIIEQDPDYRERIVIKIYDSEGKSLFANIAANVYEMLKACEACCPNCIADMYN